MSNRAAIILCGGKSSRMGFSKPLLPFGDELMLQRVARILKPLVKTRVVVAARHQLLPELDAEIKIAYDAQRYHRHLLSQPTWP